MREKQEQGASQILPEEERPLLSTRGAEEEGLI
jgi:hypothetical protein